jgi:hypothetical protein
MRSSRDAKFQEKPHRKSEKLLHHQPVTKRACEVLRKRRRSMPKLLTLPTLKMVQAVHRWAHGRGHVHGVVAEGPPQKRRAPNEVCATVAHRRHCSHRYHAKSTKKDGVAQKKQQPGKKKKEKKSRGQPRIRPEMQSAHVWRMSTMPKGPLRRRRTARQNRTRKMPRLRMPGRLRTKAQQERRARTRRQSYVQHCRRRVRGRTQVRRVQARDALAAGAMWWGKMKRQRKRR